MDALWDDSTILPRSPRNPVSSAPSLFLASPDKAPARVAERGASKSKAPNTDFNEIDELFADIDDLDDAPPPSKKKRRVAEGGSGPSARPSVGNVLLSEDEDDDDPTTKVRDSGKRGDEDEDEKKKPRKKPVKLDENRFVPSFTTLIATLLRNHTDAIPSYKDY